MPVQFTFHSDNVDYDLANGCELSPEEAQVVATLRLTEAVESVAEVIKEALELTYKELERRG